MEPGQRKGKSLSVPRCAPGAAAPGHGATAVGIFTVLASPMGLMGTGRSGRDLLLHAESYRCGLQEGYSNPLCHPTCPSPSPFPAGFCGCELGQERGDTNPPRAPGQISLIKPKLLMLSCNFYFLRGQSWLKQPFFFSSFQLLTSHELLTHHVTGAARGLLQRDAITARPAAPGPRANAGAQVRRGLGSAGRAGAPWAPQTPRGGRQGEG